MGIRHATGGLRAGCAVGGKEAQNCWLLGTHTLPGLRGDSMQGGGSDASRAQAGLMALREVGSVC